MGNEQTGEQPNVYDIWDSLSDDKKKVFATAVTAMAKRIIDYCHTVTGEEVKTIAKEIGTDCVPVAFILGIVSPEGTHVIASPNILDLEGVAKRVLSACQAGTDVVVESPKT